jgi:c-di-GMP-related signal transduction protein
MIKVSLIRGKFMELLAEELDSEAPGMDFFFTACFPTSTSC